MNATTDSKLYDDFSPEAAKETLVDVNAGRSHAEALEEYLYTDEAKEEYTARLKAEWADEGQSYSGLAPAIRTTP